MDNVDEYKKLHNGLSSRTFPDVITVLLMHIDDVFDRPYANPVARRDSWSDGAYIWLVPRQSTSLAHINLCEHGDIHVGWKPSDQDMFANDWLITTNRDLL